MGGAKKKRSLKAGIFWWPKKSHGHHKPKKNKYHVSHDENEEEGFQNWSIMSGDSPTSHRRDDAFDFGRSSPPPTTSKDTGVQAGNQPGAAGNPPAIVYASVAVDPAKGDKDKEEEGKDELCSPILNNAGEEEGRDEDNDRTVRVDEFSYSGKDRDKKDEKKKLNGEFDKLDGVYSANRDRKQPAKQEEDDDNCIVKCLYVTMQCCECTIM